MSSTCPKCGHSELRWRTHIVQVPIDQLQCQHCGHVVIKEDWWAPLEPLAPGNCLNCGAYRTDEECPRCGLAGDEDIQVHDELRQMVGGHLTLLDAARTAAKSGRKLMALKLATVAAGINDGGDGDVARGLRIWALSSMGEKTAALQDAKAWVESHPNPPAMAWATYGQELERSGFPGAAADAYGSALALDASNHGLRAQRAKILFSLNRTGQAMEELERLARIKTDDKTTAIIIDLLEKLCNMFEERYRDDEIQHLLSLCEAVVPLSALLLAHRARLCAAGGDVRLARRDLKEARRLNPELDIYERVEKAIRPQRTSWWRW